LNVNCNGGLSLLWLLWLFSSFLQLFLVFVVPVAFCTVVVKLFVIVFAAVHHQEEGILGLKIKAIGENCILHKKVIPKFQNAAGAAGAALLTYFKRLFHT